MDLSFQLLFIIITENSSPAQHNSTQALCCPHWNMFPPMCHVLVLIVPLAMCVGFSRHFPPCVLISFRCFSVNTHSHLLKNGTKLWFWVYSSGLSTWILALPKAFRLVPARPGRSGFIVNYDSFIVKNIDQTESTTLAPSFAPIWIASVGVIECPHILTITEKNIFHPYFNIVSNNLK